MVLKPILIRNSSGIPRENYRAPPYLSPDVHGSRQTELHQAFGGQVNLLTFMNRISCDACACAQPGANRGSTSTSEQRAQSATDRSADSSVLTGLFAFAFPAK